MPRGADAATARVGAARRRPPAIVRLLRLRPRDVALTLVAVILVLLAHLTVRFVSFARWSRWLTRLGRRPHLRARSSSAPRARASAAAIARASRRIPRTRCLVEAIAAMALFRLLGLDPQLHIGARRSGGAMEAHAWVVCDGVVRVGWLPDLHTFAPFPLERLARAGRLPL